MESLAIAIQCEFAVCVSHHISSHDWLRHSRGQAIDVCTELMRYQLIEHVKETRRNRAVSEKDKLCPFLLLLLLLFLLATVYLRQYYLEEIYQFSDKA